MEYELLFFTSVTNEDRIGEIKREIERVVTDQGGKISADFSDIGKRKLAYPIRKQTHAFFSFCRFTLNEKENIPEISRRLVLNDKLMRHIIVRADEIGKPIANQVTQDTRPVVRKEEKTSKPKEVAHIDFGSSQSVDGEKPVEQSAKVGMAKLDEKLNELLEETLE